MNYPAHIMVACCLLGNPRIEGEPAATNQPPPAVRNVGPGIFEIGIVRVDATKREIAFPARVNMRDGQIEYLVVSAIGKLHESIFKTDAEPYHIHAGALLLTGRRGTNAPLPVEIRVEIGGKALPPSGFVYNAEKKGAMEPAEWKYTGSRISDGTFLAQRDGSIIAIIADRDALVENLGRDRGKDEIWEPNTERLPVVGQPARITIKFKEEKPE